MNFSPALGAAEIVALSADAKAFYFTYTGSDSTLGDLEVWTNLSGAWNALPFAVVPSLSSTAEAHVKVQVASFDLSNAKPGTYQFTYRKNHAELDASVTKGTIQLVNASESLRKSKKHVELKTFDLKDGQSNAIESFDLQIAAQDWSEGVVWERSSRIWYLVRELQPGSPTSCLSTDYEGQLVYLRGKPTTDSPNAPILVIFPFTTDQVMSTIRGGDDKVWLRCMRDTGASGVRGHVVIGRGVEGDLEELVAECVKTAKNVLGGDLDQAMEKIPATMAQFPQGVRVCTWNALGLAAYKLSDVLKWLDTLLSPSKSSPLFVASLDTVLLDDGWQDFKQATWQHGGRHGHPQQTLYSFGVRPSWYDVDSAASTPVSNSIASPELTDAVKRIKAKGIQRVGVWMTIAGYWDGLEPDGPMARYDLQKWNLHSELFDEAIALWHVPSINRLEEYYGDYFKSLKAAGVDFVKVDDQAHPDYLVAGGTDDVGELRHAMHRAMRKMSNQIFGDGTTIHCMAGSPRIWGGALALRKYNGTKSVIRNSDDYFPEQDDSHRWHLYLNGTNTILSRALEFIPDFDMGEELHPWGQDYHVPFRSFSPAPTYSTDLMTRPLHPQKGWSAALAKTKQGGAGLVKTTNRIGAGLEGRLNDHVMGEGVGQAFVVALAFPEAQGAHLGAWNTRSNEAHAFTNINSNDVVEALGPLKATAAVALYVAGHDWASWINPNDLSLTVRSCAKPLVTINVQAKQSQMVTVAQSYTVDGTKIACLGLTDKTTGLAAIKAIAVSQDSSSSASAIADAKLSEVKISTFPGVFPIGQDRLRITLAFASSHLGFYVDQSKKLVFVLDGERIDKQWIKWSDQTKEGQLVEVDLEGCWSSMGEPKGSEWVVEVGHEKV